MKSHKHRIEKLEQSTPLGRALAHCRANRYPERWSDEELDAFYLTFCSHGVDYYASMSDEELHREADKLEQEVARYGR